MHDLERKVFAQSIKTSHVHCLSAISGLFSGHMGNRTQKKDTLRNSYSENRAQKEDTRVFYLGDLVYLNCSSTNLNSAIKTYGIIKENRFKPTRELVFTIASVKSLFSVIRFG